jgi:hypothetical protein
MSIGKHECNSRIEQKLIWTTNLLSIVHVELTREIQKRFRRESVTQNKYHQDEPPSKMRIWNRNFEIHFWVEKRLMRWQNLESRVSNGIKEQTWNWCWDNTKEMKKAGYKSGEICWNWFMFCSEGEAWYHICELDFECDTDEKSDRSSDSQYIKTWDIETTLPFFKSAEKVVKNVDEMRIWKRNPKFNSEVEKSDQDGMYWVMSVWRTL